MPSSKIQSLTLLHSVSLFKIIASDLGEESTALLFSLHTLYPLEKAQPFQFYSDSTTFHINWGKN